MTSLIFVFLKGLKTKCSMNVYKFPFDTQNCSVIIGSWFHSLNIIKLKIGNLSPMDLDPTKYIDITRNPIWKLIRFNAIFESLTVRNPFESAAFIT